MVCCSCGVGAKMFSFVLIFVTPVVSEFSQRVIKGGLSIVIFSCNTLLPLYSTVTDVVVRCEGAGKRCIVLWSLFKLVHTELLAFCQLYLVFRTTQVPAVGFCSQKVTNFSLSLSLSLIYLSIYKPTYLSSVCLSYLSIALSRSLLFGGQKFAL